MEKIALEFILLKKHCFYLCIPTPILVAARADNTLNVHIELNVSVIIFVEV